MTPIDRHVGGRLRALRERRQIPLEALASRVGITAAQLGAHEAGEHMAAWTLCDLAANMGVPLAGFFIADQPREPAADELARFASRETTELLRAWRRLSPEMRRRALLVVQAVAGEES